MFTDPVVVSKAVRPSDFHRHRVGGGGGALVYGRAMNPSTRRWGIQKGMYFDTPCSILPLPCCHIGQYKTVSFAF